MDPENEEIAEEIAEEITKEYDKNLKILESINIHDLNEYAVCCKTIDDLESFYEDMETPGGNLYIPDRAVPVHRRRSISRNTHYMLTHAEAKALKNDPRVVAVDLVKLMEVARKLHALDPRLYNYQSGVFSKGSGVILNSGLEKDLTTSDQKNWGLYRCLNETNTAANGLKWGAGHSTTVEPNLTGEIQFTPTGKNVDFVSVDGLMSAYDHPEFAVNPDGTGGTRFIKYNWFELNSIVNSLSPGLDLLLSDYAYVGNPFTEDGRWSGRNHGTHTAATVAGNTQGWARDANIYQIDFGDQNISGAVIWDYIRAFHKTKPINPVTGRKNPTIVNASIGNSLPFPYGNILGPVIGGTYRGTLIGGYTLGSPALTPAQLNSLGMYNFSIKDYYAPGVTTTFSVVPLMFGTEDADITAALDEGIIIVASAGNDSYYIDKPGGLDFDNEFYFSYNGEITFEHQHRGCAPGSVPGVICVGAIDSLPVIGPNEKIAYYSNRGPRIDIMAPGSFIMSAFSVNEGSGWSNVVPDPRQPVGSKPIAYVLIIGNDNVGYYGTGAVSYTPEGDVKRLQLDGSWEISYSPMPLSSNNLGTRGSYNLSGGGNIEGKLGDWLIYSNKYSAVRFVNISVGGSRIAWWRSTASSSDYVRLPGDTRFTSVDNFPYTNNKLYERIQFAVNAANAQGFSFTHVMIGLGEADAAAGTSTANYESYFATIRTELRNLGVNAPIFIARASALPPAGATNSAIQTAQQNIVDTYSDVFPGPDSDNFGAQGWYYFRVNSSIYIWWGTNGLSRMPRRWAFNMINPSKTFSADYLSQPYNSSMTSDDTYFIAKECGTSMSSPQVCGVLASKLEIYPDMNATTALEYITTTAKTLQLAAGSGTAPTWVSNTTSLQGTPNKYLYYNNEQTYTGLVWPRKRHWLRPSATVATPAVRTYPRNRIKRRG